MKEIIPYGKQFIDDSDIEAVVNVLKSDFLTQGPNILEFENAFSTYVESNYACAVNNGTSALHLSALALGVKNGTKVICPTITFAASANCIRYCGGEVIFCDIDPETYLLDLNHVKEIFNKIDGISGVISVDFAGRAVNLEELKKITSKYNAWIIQDSCHSPGGYFVNSLGENQKCGNGKYADLSIFSFHPVKHIACGEGGMITTNNKKIYNIINNLRTHGITKNKSEFISKNKYSENETYPEWYYEMQNLGYNYRLTDFQAALGISQLKKANKGIERRIQIAKTYTESFKNKKWLLGMSSNIKGHAYHLYIIEVPDRDKLYEHLRNKGIYTQVHYYPLHLMPYYNNFDVQLKNSENYINRCISLPMYPSLKNSDLHYIINSIEKFYES
jgi:UDP-4-amino-4,6-dideoxy-N-acetyl-beta-L-altrosamine transaminase